MSLVHHVNHFDAAKRGSRSGERLETEYRPDPLLDAAMILLDPIVEIRALANADRLQWSTGSIPQTALRIALEIAS